MLLANYPRKAVKCERRVAASDIRYSPKPNFCRRLLSNKGLVR